MDYAQQICEAAATITKGITDNLAFDKTIKARVINNDNAYQGQYICTYENINFMAYSSNNLIYAVNEMVMVSIPLGDWKNQKTILDRVRIIKNEEEKEYDYLWEPKDNVSPFDMEFTITNLHECSKIKDGTAYEVPSVNIDKIKFNFDLNSYELSPYNIGTGDYGIKITGTNNNGGIVWEKELDINTNYLKGNFYGAEEDLPQEAIFDFPKNNSSVIYLTFNLYSKTNFRNKVGELIDFENQEIYPPGIPKGTKIMYAYHDVNSVPMSYEELINVIYFGSNAGTDSPLDIIDGNYIYYLYNEDETKVYYIKYYTLPNGQKKYEILLDITSYFINKGLPTIKIKNMGVYFGRKIDTSYSVNIDTNSNIYYSIGNGNEKIISVLDSGNINTNTISIYEGINNNFQLKETLNNYTKNNYSFTYIPSEEYLNENEIQLKIRVGDLSNYNESNIMIFKKSISNSVILEYDNLTHKIKVICNGESVGYLTPLNE